MPDIDQYTAQLAPETKATVSGQYFDLNQPFAFPRYGNECTPFINGRDYMKAVAAAIRGAQKFIMITGWQLDYDVELDNRGEPGHPGRLSELLADAVQRGVHVRVMLYDSISYALDTHDDVSQENLDALVAAKGGSIQVMVQNPNTGRSSAASQVVKAVTGAPKNTNVFFSHHQKSVVIDGSAAFVGGLDLAYGRWDTNAFNVVVDPAMRVINDAYNMQIDPARGMTAQEKALTQERNSRPGFHTSYMNGSVLDAKFQPRQPWQDVALRIKGPAAFDVFVNFVLRWNSFAGSGTNVFDVSMNSNWFEKCGGSTTLVDPLAKGSGSASVQICRSASSAQLSDEVTLWDSNHKYVSDDWKQPALQRRAVAEKARRAWMGDHQTSIKDAMINCIRSAQACIYVENQFFMSNCGPDQRGTACPSDNAIIAELANAVGKAVQAGRPFHVYLVLPEHAEGKLEDAATLAQAWWALQGVKRARDSLINRINRQIVRKNMSTWGVSAIPTSANEVGLLLASHGHLNKWKEYLTVLNLRNYGHTTTTVLTELIYVHTKLLIVDDAVAVIGSANINDRSLNGNGDTELAAVIVDDADAKLTDLGGGAKVVTRHFARELRMQLWRKHLGMLVDEPSTTGVKRGAPPEGIKIETPVDASTIRGIQKLASANRAAYNEVFTHTPRDSFKTMEEGRAAYKKMRRNGRAYGVAFDLRNQPDLQPAFMTALAKPTILETHVHNVKAAINVLDAKVKGFWVAMPLEWGQGQSATPKSPTNSPVIIAQRQGSLVKEVSNV
jgi:phospholipase D1/2